MIPRWWNVEMICQNISTNESVCVCVCIYLEKLNYEKNIYALIMTPEIEREICTHSYTEEVKHHKEEKKREEDTNSVTRVVCDLKKGKM